MSSNIKIKNLYYMLCYAFDEAIKAETNVDREEFKNIFELLAFILEQDVSYLVKKGIYKDYIFEDDDLTIIRGKINFNQSIKHLQNNKKILHCEYDNFSEDVLLNQILKASITFLLTKRKEINNKLLTNLKRLSYYFLAITKVNLNSIDWNSIRFHRQNYNYKKLLFCCELLANMQIMNESEANQYAVSVFVDESNNNRLYEKFLRGYFYRHYPEITHRSNKKINWGLSSYTSKEFLPTMLSDIYLASKDNVLIIDAKYYNEILSTKNGNSAKYHSNNLYQIFSYVKNENFILKENGTPKNVAGMLLYAKTDTEDYLPESEYVICGSSILIRVLNLNTEFKNIKNVLDSIAKKCYQSWT